MSTSHSVQIGARVLPLLLAALLSSCGGDAPPGGDDAGEADRTLSSGSSDASSALPPDDAARIEGEVSFQVEGRAITLDYLPEGNNYYMRAAASVLARSGPEEEEQFMLVFMSTDLRAHDIPGEFPPQSSGSSIATAMQSVGFSYIDPTGEEWAGPGRVFVESFSDAGVLTASFESVTIPHTDRERPDLTLTNGRIRAWL